MRRCGIDGFSERLELLMNSLGLSQTEFSDLLEITPAALSQLLNGLRDPSASTLMKFHEKTGVSIDYLFGYTSGRRQSKDAAGLTKENSRLRGALIKVANANPSVHLAHPQSVWWQSHIVPIAKEALK